MLSHKVQQFIRKHSLVKKGDRVLVAYSGGPDSTCLLLLLREVFKETAAIYVNHQLRGKESKQEEAFVKRFCAQQEIPLFVERIHWKKKPSNLEEAARKRRYRHLAKVAAEHGYSKVALAHHKDDAAETLLLHLIRGSGPQGLAGLPPQRGIYVRPLLECTREEIVQYLSDRRAPYFTDTTNALPNFLRNRIRTELIPAIQKNYNPAFTEALHRTALWIREQNDLVAELLQRYKNLIRKQGNRFSLRSKQFLRLSVPLRKAILRLVLKEADSSLKMTSRSLERLLAAIDRRENLELPGFLMVRSTLNSVEFSQKTNRVGYFEMDVPHEGSYFFSPGNSILTFSKQNSVRFEPTKNVAFLDLKKASFPLHVRNWKKGDSFRPLGMTGHKKLSDFWIDRKVPRHERKKVPLVFKDDELVCVAGYEIDHQYRITDATRRVLRVEVKHV